MEERALAGALAAASHVHEDKAVAFAATTTTLGLRRRCGRGCGARRRMRRDARYDLPMGDDGELATRVRDYA